ncbi:Uncharacterised protein [Porphyromonas macacae]|uniref:Uncharacterized protein n=1 Tax=Porphyromonas macacae TaxID=28115 RepID=A0A379EAB5_9PORP|nr:Uncharacterised protein [Porphyromonas macacae]
MLYAVKELTSMKGSNFLREEKKITSPTKPQGFYRIIQQGILSLILFCLDQIIKISSLSKSYKLFGDSKLDFFTSRHVSLLNFLLLSVDKLPIHYTYQYHNYLFLKYYHPAKV